MHVVLAALSVLLQQPAACGPAPAAYSGPRAAVAPAGCQPAAPPACQPPPPPPVCRPPLPPVGMSEPLPPPVVVHQPPPVVVRLPPPAVVGWEVSASAGRVAVRGMGVEATADKLTFAEGRLVLAGRVKVKCAGGQVSGERASIRTGDGCVEVGGAQVPAPLPSVPGVPVVPSCLATSP